MPYIPFKKNVNETFQVNELLANIIAYNLTVVIHEMYENGIEPEFLHGKSKNIKLYIIFDIKNRTPAEACGIELKGENK
jgi:hypothetical protein